MGSYKLYRVLGFGILGYIGFWVLGYYPPIIRRYPDIVPAMKAEFP